MRTVVGAEAAVRVDRTCHRLERGASTVDHGVAAQRGDRIIGAVELGSWLGRARGRAGVDYRVAHHAREDARLLVLQQHVENARVVEDPAHAIPVGELDRVAGHVVSARGADGGPSASAHRDCETERRREVLERDVVCPGGARRPERPRPGERGGVRVRLEVAAVRHRKANVEHHGAEDGQRDDHRSDDHDRLAALPLATASVHQLSTPQPSMWKTRSSGSSAWRCRGRGRACCSGR